MSTKQEIIDEICALLGIPSFKVSTGSTEPKEFLEAIVDQLGLAGISKGFDKQELGKFIVESSGELWLPVFDSTGGTVTKEGLYAIRDAVFYLTIGRN
jgi:hypothetical protein